MRKIILLAILSMSLAACQKASNIVIDTSQPINAQLTYFEKDSVDIANYINNDSSQLVISDSFQISLSNPENFSHLNVTVTNDSGTTIASDRYASLAQDFVSGAVLVAPPSVYVGNLTYTFTVYNQVGAPGNSISAIVRLFNSKNHPPVIDTVSAPDSVRIQDSTAVLLPLYTTVSDPDGLNDIKTVYFDTFKPDGAPSSGNPFRMYDDGGASGNPADGDSVANDGIYTLIVQLPALKSPSPPALGTYIFKFYAVDRSGAVSKPVSHNIKVYQ